MTLGYKTRKYSLFYDWLSVIFALRLICLSISNFSKTHRIWITKVLEMEFILPDELNKHDSSRPSSTALYWQDTDDSRCSSEWVLLLDFPLTVFDRIFDGTLANLEEVLIKTYFLNAYLDCERKTVYSTASITRFRMLVRWTAFTTLFSHSNGPSGSKSSSNKKFYLCSKSPLFIKISFWAPSI